MLINPDLTAHLTFKHRCEICAIFRLYQRALFPIWFGVL